MKKEWKKPELETLDVSLTMASLKGTQLDGDYLGGTPLSQGILS